MTGPIPLNVVYLRFPDDRPRAGVERDHKAVGRSREENLIVVNRDVSGRRRGVPSALGWIPPVLPNQITRGSVHGFNDAPRMGNVHDSVIHQRNELDASGIQGSGPHQLKVPDILPVDPVERTVRPSIVGAAPLQPISIRGVLQDRVRDRMEVTHLRLGAHGGKCQSTRR